MNIQSAVLSTNCLIIIPIPVVDTADCWRAAGQEQGRQVDHAIIIIIFPWLGDKMVSHVELRTDGTILSVLLGQYRRSRPQNVLQMSKAH